MKIFRKIYRKVIFSSIKNCDEEPDVDDWFAFMGGLPKPNDYIDESYNKYRCREYYFQKYKSFFLNIVSFPLYLWMRFHLLGIKQYSVAPNSGKLIIEIKKDVDYKDILPCQFYDDYSSIEKVKSEKSSRNIEKPDFIQEAKDIFKKIIKRHPFDFYYLLWIGKELSKHSKYIKKYNPVATAVYIEERNIASPILRHLYESTNRKYISFMHGMYLLQLIQGYMGFTEYYIWDKEYEITFSRLLKCNINKYIVYKPIKLQKKWDLKNENQEYYCTYYLSGESKESIKLLRDIFDQFDKNGKKCLVRPHPRVSHWELIHRSFPESMIEDFQKISLKESLKRTKYVLGLETTVLAEAYCEGKDIVIDDITNRTKYLNLKKRKMITLKWPHLLLSDLINNGYEK